MRTDGADLDHARRAAQSARGPDGIRALFGSFGQVEQTWTVEDMIAEGDKVVVRAANSCVMESFFGIDGRGKRQTFTATFTHRIAGGLIQQTWRNADDLGRLLQLGARIVPEIAMKSFLRPLVRSRTYIQTLPAALLLAGLLSACGTAAPATLQPTTVALPTAAPQTSVALQPTAAPQPSSAPLPTFAPIPTSVPTLPPESTPTAVATAIATDDCAAVVHLAPDDAMARCLRHHRGHAKGFR